jgi:hypothetical protein
MALVDGGLDGAGNRSNPDLATLFDFNVPFLGLVSALSSLPTPSSSWRWLNGPRSVPHHAVSSKRHVSSLWISYGVGRAWKLTS